MKTPKSIIVIGRRWRDKPNGNTYHTSQIIVDGQTIHTTDRHYGYENHYVQTARDWLIKNGYLPKFDNNQGRKNQPLWAYCSDMNINLEYSAIDVERQKDL